jgi:hypothetical protein
MPSYADWVATSALALSLCNAGWQMRRAASDRVHLRSNLGFTFCRDLNDKIVLGVTIRVTNFGSAAATIRDVHWEKQSLRSYMPFSGLVSSGATSRSTDIVFSGPSLPHTIQGYDLVEWVIAGDIFRKYYADDSVRAVIHFVEPPRLLAWRLTGRDAVEATDWTTLTFDVPEESKPRAEADGRSRAVHSD